MLVTGLASARALITGGASGIGHAIAEALLAEGADVTVADLHSPPSTAEPSRIPRSIIADLGQEQAAVRAVHEAEDLMGGLNLFVNCAARTDHQAACELTTEALERTMRTNLYACMWAGREVARRFSQQRAGAILVIGSTVTCNPAGGEAAYRASKTGLMSYLETLAIELAPYGVRANMLTPGAFATGLTAGQSSADKAAVLSQVPLGREGHPDELAATALVLLSDRLSPYTTGANVVVDGGLRLRPLRLWSGSRQPPSGAVQVDPNHAVIL